VLCISVLLVAIDNTIVNVVLTTLKRRINASTADLQWIVTAYSLLFAGLILVAGHLGDRMGVSGYCRSEAVTRFLEPFRSSPGRTGCSQ
jgi:MFS family permease